MRWVERPVHQAIELGEETMSQTKPVISIEYDHRYWYILEVQGDTLVGVTKTNKGKPNCTKTAKRLAEEKGLEFVETLERRFLPEATRRART